MPFRKNNSRLAILFEIHFFEICPSCKLVDYKSYDVDFIMILNISI